MFVISSTAIINSNLKGALGKGQARGRRGKSYYFIFLYGTLIYFLFPAVSLRFRTWARVAVVHLVVVAGCSFALLVSEDVIPMLP